MLKDERKKKIMKIAFKLFLEKGYEETTVRVICSKAKIEAPTLYYYFKSKKGLFLAIIDDIVEHYNMLLSDLKLDLCVNPDEKLYNFYQFCLNYAVNHEPETRFYLRYQLFRPSELNRILDEHMERTFNEKEALLKDALNELINQFGILSP